MLRALAHDEVAEVAAAVLLRVRLEALLARPVADGVADPVAEVGREPALLDVEHLVPAAGAVEAEREARLGARERVLHLVAVVEDLRLARDDLLERRLGDPREPLERVAHLRVLLRELRAWYSRSWKRQPPHAGKCAHGASTRGGPGRTTSVASASACDRFTFVTRARTRSPGSPRRTKTTKPFSRATPLPPYASDSTSSSSSSSLCTGAATGPQ